MLKADPPSRPVDHVQDHARRALGGASRRGVPPAGRPATRRREHLKWTLAEAVARLQTDWDNDVAAYNRIHRDILHMADMLSIGIIKQFQRRF